MTKTTRKRKKAVKAIKKAVGKAVKRGVSGKDVEDIVEKTIANVVKTKNSDQKARSKTTKDVRARKTS